MEKSRLGPFALEERLDPDQSGSVFRAVHIQQRRSFALTRRPAPLLRNNQAAHQAWAEEFETLKALRHPHLVRCFGGGLDEMEVYLIHELVYGQSLRQLLDFRGRLPWEAVVEYALQICDGLEAAHQHGLVHGELAPDKVLVDEQDQVKLLGFRAQRMLDASYRLPRERPLDKLTYTAPEQLLDLGPASPKADLYAVGCMLFEMLTGRPVFEAETAEQMVQCQVKETPPRVAALVLDCPVWLDVLIQQLLEKDPRKRPHAAATVILALRETKRKVAQGTGVAEHAVSGLSPLKSPADKQEVRKLLGQKKPRKKGSERPPLQESSWFLAACLVLLIGAVGAWLWWPVSPSRMLQRAERLMETDDRYQWAKARKWYLDPLLEREPDGPLADRARIHIDTIEMDAAERRLRFHARLGMEPESEGERLFAEARQLEQTGDPLAALDKYVGLETLLDDSGPDRPFILLARQRITALRDDPQGTAQRQQLLAQRMEDARGLAENGQLDEARQIWQSIVRLYSYKPEVQDLVEQARQRLADAPAEEDSQ